MYEQTSTLLLPEEIWYAYQHPQGQSALVVDSALPSMMKLERFMYVLKRIWHIDDVRFIKMNVSLNELVTNAIVHGNKCSNQKQVYVQVVRSKNRIAVMIQDQGPGFNHKDVQDPADVDKVTGQGIYIARNLADEVYYSPKGNCVWLLFRQPARNESSDWAA